jgi:hypothetical protein
MSGPSCKLVRVLTLAKGDDHNQLITASCIGWARSTLTRSRQRAFAVVKPGFLQIVGEDALVRSSGASKFCSLVCVCCWVIVVRLRSPITSLRLVVSPAITPGVEHAGRGQLLGALRLDLMAVDRGHRLGERLSGVQVNQRPESPLVDLRSRGDGLLEDLLNHRWPSHERPWAGSDR